jgi:hypothetical protein
MTDTKRPQITGRVNGSLRDRIAYAIAQADGDLPGMEPDSWDYELADAVIRELGLTRVTRSERVPKHRYVTEWENDDASS